MTRQLFALLLLMVSVLGHGQATKSEKPKDTVPYKVRYDKLKELYLKKLDSKSYRTADSIFQVFVYKITSEIKLSDIEKENNVYIDWVKDHLAETDFKDMAEAEMLWAGYSKAVKESTLENCEYFDYLKELRGFKESIDISIAVMDEVRKEYPEKRNRLKFPKRKKKSDFYPKLPGQ